MYEIKSRIRYSEIGYKNQLTSVGLVNYFQDCNTFQSEDIGLGLSSLRTINRAWLLSGWQIDLKRMPMFGEEVLVRTWPYGFKGFIGYRNYVMEDTKGNVLAAANAIWTLINTETKAPMRITDDDIKGYEVSEKFDMEYTSRKIKLEGVGEKQSHIIIGKERIDTNKHMNNGQYISIAEEFVPEELSFDRIRVEYKKEVKYGTEIVPVIYKSENGVTVAFESEEGQNFAVVEFTKQK